MSMLRLNSDSDDNNDLEELVETKDGCVIDVTEPRNWIHASLIRRHFMSYRYDNILQCYKTRKKTHPLLWTCQGFSCSACMQVTVERLLQNMGFILAGFRFSTKDNSLQDILILRC
jgi:hypothetical protein